MTLVNNQKSIDKKEEHKAQESKMKFIGNAYRNSQQMIEIARICRYDTNTNDFYQEQISYMTLIEKILGYCSDNTQLIIRNEYLENHKKNWYLEFFKSNHYYILRRKAVDEFMGNFMRHYNRFTLH